MHENIHPHALAFQKVANAIRRNHGVAERQLLSKVEPVYKSTKEQLKALFAKSNESQTKVLITGLPRTGTGYVSSLLESHPSSFIKGEVFDLSKHLYKNYVLKAQELAAKRTQELFSLKFLAFQSPRYVTDLQELGNLGWKIIGLHRKNISLQALSYYLSTAFDTFHRFNESKNRLPIKVHLEWLNVVKGILTVVEAELLDHYQTLQPFIQIINFEKDIIEESRCADIISHFLKMPAEFFQEKEQPTFSNKWELISNADEVKGWLSEQLP